MADDTPNNGNVEKTIHQEILRILAERRQQISPLSNAQTLDNDLGLTSSELLQLFALLAVKLQVDPVEQSVATANVRTVGDLCQRYEALLTGASNASNMRGMLLASQKRAEARRARRQSEP